MPEKVTDEELLKRIIWDDADGYECISTKLRDQSRWHVWVETIFKRISDNKLFICHWRRAATEQQEHEFPEEAFEAEPYRVSYIKYRQKKD